MRLPGIRSTFLYGAIVGSALLLAPSTASAIPFTVTGATTGALATAGGTLTIAGDILTLTLDNTSPFDARITGIGFDLAPIGNASASGADGASNVQTQPNFTFDDGGLGNVPQFNLAVLDFGWLTGKSFAGGKPNDGLAPPGGAVVFMANIAALAGFSEADFVDALFLRFQRVGPDGELSDVGSGGGDAPDAPEPASMVLFGVGLLATGMSIRRRNRRVRLN